MAAARVKIKAMREAPDAAHDIEPAVATSLEALDEMAAAEKAAADADPCGQQSKGPGMVTTLKPKKKTDRNNSVKWSDCLSEPVQAADVHSVVAWVTTNLG